MQKLWIVALAALAAALSTAALGVALAGAAGQRAAAGPVPATVAYQGFLTDVRGNPVPNGSRTITFRLYSAPTGGAALWQETQTLATDRGVFNAMLGSASAFGNAFDTAPLYLGVQLAGEAELRPRQELAATPFALRASNADALGGAPASAFVRNAGTGLQATQILGQRALGLDDAYRLPQGCAAGKVAKWGFTSLSSQGWICGSDVAGDDVDVASFQQRISGRCAGGRAARTFRVDGTAECSETFAAANHSHPAPRLDVVRIRNQQGPDPNASGITVVEALCPAGYTVTGGGFGGIHDREGAELIASGARITGASGWRVSVRLEPGVEITANAVCMRLLP